MMSGIEKFWEWFRRSEGRLREVDSSEHPMLDESYRMLARVSEELTIEFSTGNEGSAELIISAGGRKELFPLVESMIRQAPEVPGWTFTALKPPMGFEFHIDHEGVRYDPRQMFFRPPASGHPRLPLALQVYLPSFDPRKGREAEGVLWKVLDTALGERAIAEDISSVDLVGLKSPREAQGLLPLPALTAYLEDARKG